MVVIRPRKHPTTFGILSKEVNLYTFGYKWHKQKKDVMYCLHYVFRCCGGRTRTCDLQVMSLASYQLLHSAILTMFQKHFSELRVQRYGLSGEYANVVG